MQQPFPQHHRPRSVKGRVEAACPMAAPVSGMEATAANRTKKKKNVLRRQILNKGTNVCQPYSQWVRPVRLTALNKDFEASWNGVSTTHSVDLLPPNESMSNNGNTSPISSPNAALGPRRVCCKTHCIQWWMGRLAMWDEPQQIRDQLWTFAAPTKFTQLCRSKRWRFHAIRVSSPCKAEGPQWIGRISENLCPRFVGVRSTWYDVHLQSTQGMKQQNQNWRNVAT